jgi:small subunit ribosomal protein S5
MMAEEEKIIAPEVEEEKPVLEVEKDVITQLPDIEVAPTPAELKPNFDVATWTPKTELGRKVKSGEITNMVQALRTGERIMEAQIVDILLPNIESDMLWIGQSRGKFGGGQRRLFKQTQKKTPEGNKPSFGTLAVVGNRDGIVGLGYGKSKDTVPAREKALRNAKLNVFMIRRGSGSWESNTKDCARVLELAGVKDIWSKASGQTRRTRNLVFALEDALRKLAVYKHTPSAVDATGMIEGPVAEARK